MNPYMPPLTCPSTAYAKPHKRVNRTPTNVRTIIRSWERMRIPYNLILLPFGLAVAVIATSSGMPWGEVVFGSVSVAFFANAFYFFGPLFELYSCCSRQIEEFGRWRFLPFTLGLLVSLALFFMVAAMFSSLPWAGVF